MEKYSSTVGPAIKVDRKQVSLEAAVDQVMELEIAERAEDAGQYRFLGETIWVDDIIDPALVKEIRTFVPEYVPLLTKRQYRSPAGTVIDCTYHVIGRWIPHPQKQFKDAAVHLEHVPRGFPFNPRQIHPLRTLWAPWREPNWDGEGASPDPEWANSSPPAYVKPGPWLARLMRRVHKAFEVQVNLKTNEDGELVETNEGRRQFLVDKLNELKNAQDRDDDRLREAAFKEARDRVKDNWRQLKKAADEEKWLPEPPDDRPKPFVDLGG